MAVEEGTYLIINANANKALDVNGGGDQSGANVQLWDVIRSDAQMWTLVRTGYTWRICCSLTGNWLDLENGNTANGTNIRQWSENGAPAQRWLISATGDTVTYGGETYDTYTIATSIAASGTQKVLDAAGGGTAAGTNVLLWEATGSVWQSWILVPVDVLTEGGTYRIVSEMDTRLCVDITAASEASGAKACVWSDNDGANQVFEAVPESGGLVRLVAAHSGKSLDVDHGADADGRAVLQWPSESGNPNQLWLPVQAGTVKIDGVTVPTYELRNQSGSNRCMDVSGASKVPGTNLVVWTRLGKSNQRFAFVKAEALGTGIPAPTPVTPVAFERDGLGEVVASGMTFTCPEGAYQARFTWRDHFDAQRRTYTGTHPWRNVRDGSTARSGWGDAWAPTFTADGGEVDLPFEFAAELTEDNPYVELVIEVRAFRESYGVTGGRAHGPVIRTVVRLRRKPEVELDEVRLWARRDGEDQPWKVGALARAHDALGTAVTRLRARLVGQDGLPITEWAAHASLSEITWDASRHMRRIPNVGETVGLQYDLTNVEGAVGRGTVWGPFAYGTGALSVVPTVETIDADMGLQHVLVQPTDADACLLEVSQHGHMTLEECPLADDGELRHFAVCPPLNRDSRVLVMSRVGTAYGIGSATVRAESDCRLWNWGDVLDQCAALHVNVGDHPRSERSHSTEVALHSTTGGGRPVATSWGVERLDLGIEGVSLDEAIHPNATEDAMERLAMTASDGEHPIYRTPRGDWHRVVVTGLDSGWQQPGYVNARVEQQAVRS